MESDGSGSGLAVHPEQAIRLNLGAGHKRMEGWISVDLAGEPDVRSDVLKLPFEDNYADEIMAIHLFEHLYRWDVDAALAEWLRVLKPGGKLVLELPDLIKCCRNVLTIEDERMGLWGLYGDPGYREPLMVHKFGYTPKMLRALLEKAGFQKVREKTPQFHKPARDMRLEARK